MHPGVKKAIPDSEKLKRERGGDWAFIIPVCAFDAYEL
jgi:hypothetical protein